MCVQLPLRGRHGRLGQVPRYCMPVGSESPEPRAPARRGLCQRTTFAGPTLPLHREGNDVVRGAGERDEDRGAAVLERV